MCQQSANSPLSLPMCLLLPSKLQVLSVFPTTISRRILQYLYMRHLRRCYLFAQCPQRFLDSLLASARVEVFMPGAWRACVWWEVCGGGWISEGG